MVKSKGLHINKSDLERMIEKFGVIINTECINQSNNQHKYELQVNGIDVAISVYFRKDNTISCVAQGSGESGELSKEIVSYIKENVNFKNVSSGTFTCKISKDRFQMLKEYLLTLQGVVLEKEEDKGQNGNILQFTSDIGDRVTLTFWESRGTMLFQGYLLLLHVEVKSFIGVFDYVKTELDCDREEEKTQKQAKVNEIINKKMPSSYTKLNPILQDLIYDSTVQIVERNELRDYSAWTFPILKALEGRTKQILSFNNIRINDKIGFKIKPQSSTEYKNIFVYDGNSKSHSIDTSIVSIQDVNTLNALAKCYSYLCKNRNTTFHVSQILNFTRKVQKPEEAENIFFNACEVIEDSYILLGK